MNKGLLALFAACLFTSSGKSLALPVLSGIFTDNGQVVSATDTVTSNVRLTNSGDMAFTFDWDFVNTGGVTGYIGNFTNLSALPGFSASPLAPGASIDLPWVTFTPLGGTAGVGSYTSQNNVLGFDDGTVVQFGDFTWRVAEMGNVPGPATLALLGVGLAALGWSRRTVA